MIDLKWGVPEKILEQFYNDELVRYEINRCREQSIGPDLVVGRVGPSPSSSSLIQQLGAIEAQ
jgi:hypothetical protein